MLYGNVVIAVNKIKYYLCFELTDGAERIKPNLTLESHFPDDKPFLSYQVITQLLLNSFKSFTTM